MRYIPERLKSSRRLQVEIAVGALALWYLKKEVYPKYDGPTPGEDILPPVSEVVGDSYVYSIPSDFNESGQPQFIQIGRLLKSRYITLQGKFDEAQDFFAERSPNSRKDLRRLKKGLKLSRKKMLKRIKAAKSH